MVSNSWFSELYAVWQLELLLRNNIEIKSWYYNRPYIHYITWLILRKLTRPEQVWGSEVHNNSTEPVAGPEQALGGEHNRSRRGSRPWTFAEARLGQWPRPQQVWNGKLHGSRCRPGTLAEAGLSLLPGLEQTWNTKLHKSRNKGAALEWVGQRLLWVGGMNLGPLRE